MKISSKELRMRTVKVRYGKNYYKAVVELYKNDRLSETITLDFIEETKIYEAQKALLDSSIENIIRLLELQDVKLEDISRYLSFVFMVPVTYHEVY